MPSGQRVPARVEITERIEKVADATGWRNFVMFFDKTFQRITRQNRLFALAGKKHRITYQNPCVARFVRVTRIKRLND